MNRTYSKTWNTSVQPRKQRKYRFNAPLHTKRTFMAVHLSRELREKHKLRSLLVRKGDTVKILRGMFKGRTGKVTKVDVKKEKVYVEGADAVKKDGTKINSPIHPSNLVITILVLEDKKRQKSIARSQRG